MKIKSALLVLVAAFTTVTACQKPTPELDPQVDLAQKELNFSADGGRQTVSFVSTRAWAFKGTPDWVVIEPERGDASDKSQTVSVSVLANTGNDRECQITLSGGIVKDYLTIKQEGPGGQTPVGDGSLEKPFSATEANAVAAKLADGATTDQAYYVHGFVKSFGSKHEDGIKNFGNALFYITDDNTLEGDDFYCFQVNYLGGQKFTSLDQLKIGDEVIVYGKLTNYGGTYETVNKGAAYIYSINGETGGDIPVPGPVEPISGTNLLSNGSFEDWTGSKPADWEFASGNATLVKSSDAKDGSVSCEVQGANTNKRLMSKIYALKPGTYQVQAYYKGEGMFRSGYAKLTNGIVADTSKDFVYIEDAPVQATSEWTMHFVQFTLTEQTEVSVLVMNSDKGNGKSFLIDDIKLVTEDGGIAEGGAEEFPDPSTLTQISCAEFNALPTTDAGWYILEGEVMSVADNNKGVLYLKDESGETSYVYEVLNAALEYGKFASLGVEPGDVLKVYGKHADYNGTIEMSPAVFMDLTKGEHPEIPAVVTLTFPDDNKANNATSSYLLDWEAKIGSYSFNISCFNNNSWNDGWSFVKCGTKKGDTKPYIATADAISKVVGSVIVTIDKINSEASSVVKSAKLIVASDAAFSQNVQTVDISMSVGSQTINVPTPGQNLFYKLEFDIKQSKDNGVIQISKIVFAEAE